MVIEVSGSPSAGGDNGCNSITDRFRSVGTARRLLFIHIRRGVVVQLAVAASRTRMRQIDEPRRSGKTQVRSVDATTGDICSYESAKRHGSLWKF